MNKESPEDIDFIFKRAINVHYEKEDRNTAILRIHNKTKTNKASCAMYIRIISSMLKGERYPVGMSSTATDDILKNFYSYNNAKFFNNSVHSLEQYIYYYENNKGKPPYKLREVLSKWAPKMTKG